MPPLSYMKDKITVVEDVLQPFQCTGVTLLPSRIADQVASVKAYYMGLHPNDILRGFRARKGDWAPGKELGGAYSESGLCFGQWLSGFARLYKSTGDPQVGERALYLMREWAKTIDQDGYFGYTDRGGDNQYLFDKYVCGLVDIYEFMECAEALEVLARITGYMERKCFDGETTDRNHEWYTLPENLYRAYLLTGDKRYFDFAKRFEYTEYWDAFANEEDPFGILPPPEKREGFHAYSHVNTFSSAAMAYAATGERKYLDTVVNAYNWLKETQLYATGGYGPEENLVVPDGLPDSLIDIKRNHSDVDLRFHFETSCGSWAAFKMAKYLMRFTGQAHYGDWIERLIYNGVGALSPMNEYGMIQYGSNYSVFGAQKMRSTVWFCCQGSLLQNIGDYSSLIFFKDEENLYVNLFLPAKVHWKHSQGEVIVEQETSFPEESTVRLKIQCASSQYFGLRFRVPGWSNGVVQVQINGEAYSVDTVAGQWATLQRNWDTTSVVELQFDMSIRGEPLTSYLSPVAVLSGPVVLAKASVRSGHHGGIPVESALRYPADWLDIESEVRLNRFRQLHYDQELRPLYDIRRGEFYQLYHTRHGEESLCADSFEYSGDWKTNSFCRYTASANATCEIKFEGAAICLEGIRGEDGGMADIYIDSEHKDTMDQFAYTRARMPRYDQSSVPFRWSIDGLSMGEHTVRIVAKGQKGDRATGSIIRLSGAKVYKLRKY